MSHQHYRGIAMDKASGAFKGRIVVNKNAMGCEAHQLSKNIVLSSQAEIDTAPELEIYADDKRDKVIMTLHHLRQQMSGKNKPNY